MCRRGVYISVVLSRAGSLRGGPAVWVMLMRYAAVTLLIAVLTPSAVRAQILAPSRTAEKVKLSSMLGGAVTFTLPAGWHVSMYINTSQTGAAEIRNTEGLRDKPQARFFLSALPLREKKTVREMSGDTSGSHLRKILGGTVLSEKFDGDDWRTVIWTAVVNGEPHVVLEHFGIVNDKYVYLAAHVPLGSGDVVWMKQVVVDFNAACESLKIDGQGSFENKVSPDIITEQLKVGAKK
jgi:hypothetical protein